MPRGPGSSIGTQTAVMPRYVECGCASSCRTSQTIPFNEDILHSLLGGDSTMAPVFRFHKS